MKPDELLKPGVRAVVAGAPGCGKTTLLRWLANQTLKADSRLPVFIELKALPETAFANGETLGDVLHGAILKRFLNAADDLPTAACAAFKTHLNEKLRAGEVAIFLDGLDEIRERKIFDPLRTAVESFLASAAKDAALIFSTRPYAVQRAFAGGLEEMEIAPLGAKQIEAFLTRYFGDHADAMGRLRERLKRERTLADLARVPFLLGAMAGLFARGGGTAADRLTLYGEIARDLAGRLDKEKGVERFRIDDSDGEMKREFLTEFACARLFDGTEADVARRLMFTGKDLKEFAKRHCAAHSYLASVNPNWLALDATATPLLREVGTDAYAFAHLTLQEYLAAVGLMRRADAKETLCKAIFNPTLAAMEVLPMALSLAEKPDEIYAALEALPESLDFVNLRVRARGLAYAGDKLAQSRIDALADRFMEFFLEKVNRQERPYDDAVMRSFFNAVGRAQCALTDRLLAVLCDDRNDNLKWRLLAVETLGNLGARTPNVIEKLTILCRNPGEMTWDHGPDPTRQLSSKAVVALWKLDALPPEMDSAEALALDNITKTFVKEAMTTLSAATPDEKSALSDLEDDDPKVSKQAAAALGKLGAATPNLIAQLLPALGYNNWKVWRNAAQALERIAEQSPDVFLDGLRLALTGDDFNARRIAARVIGYYTDDPEILRTLAHLAIAGPTDELRTTARDAATRYTHKLILFGKEFQALELHADMARAMSLEETRGFMAHEFRSALIPVAGYAKMLGDALHEADIHNDKITRYIERIIAQSQSALTLVNRYVDFSRPLVPKPESVNVSALLQELLHEMHPDCGPNGITISRDIPEAVLATADRAMLAQALRNILRNAVEAMERNVPGAPKVLRVSVRRIEKQVILSVKDSGPGIKSEHLARIFNLGFTTKLGTQGSGVGLALVRRLIREGNQGDISIDNNLDSVGATATISLVVAEEKRDGA